MMLRLDAQDTEQDVRSNHKGEGPYVRARGGPKRNDLHLGFVRGDAQAAGGRQESGMRGSLMPFAHARH